MAQILGIAIQYIVFIFFVINTAYPWGSTAHKFINLKAVKHLPGSMNDLKKDSLFYQSYASAPDYRKNSSDTSFFAETYRHYIDIDIYPNFHTLPHALDSMIMLYGREYVRLNGTLPWTIQIEMDSLTAQLARGNLTKAESTMSDLGHYVADAHQPLHCTENYDGWLTDNGGIHSRYETSMINMYQSTLSVDWDSVRYIDSPLDFAFEFIYNSNTLVDSVLTADTYAKMVSGWTGTGTPPASYYEALWQKTQNITKEEIQQATVALASLWYTAWLNAMTIASVKADEYQTKKYFALEQNYPNPFNPLTVIGYRTAVHGLVTLKIYDVLGREMKTLVNEVQKIGCYEVKFDGSGLPSGTYIARLESARHGFSMKVILLK